MRLSLYPVRALLTRFLKPVGCVYILGIGHNFPVPSGTAENSPALQRRDIEHYAEPVPSRTTETQELCTRLSRAYGTRSFVHAPSRQWTGGLLSAVPPGPTACRPL